MNTIVLPKRSRIASFDVDAQKTFTPLCPEELPVSGGDEIVAALNAQAKYAAYRLGSKDAHHPRADFLASDEHPAFSSVDNPVHHDIYWPAHAVVGTSGFDLLDGLPKPEAYDFFVWKGVELYLHPYGACYHDLAGRLSTGVIEFLKVKRVTHVLVGGLATDFCVATTVKQLMKAGFTVIVNRSACRAIDDAAAEKFFSEVIAEGSLVINDVCDLVMT